MTDPEYPFDAGSPFDLAFKNEVERYFPGTVTEQAPVGPGPWYVEVLWTPGDHKGHWVRSYAHHAIGARLWDFKTLEEAHSHVTKHYPNLLSPQNATPTFRVRFVHSANGPPPIVTSTVYNIPLTAEGEEPM